MTSRREEASSDTGITANTTSTTGSRGSHSSSDRQFPAHTIRQPPVTLGAFNYTVTLETSDKGQYYKIEKAQYNGFRDYLELDSTTGNVSVSFANHDGEPSNPYKLPLRRIITVCLILIQRCGSISGAPPRINLFFQTLAFNILT